MPSPRWPNGPEIAVGISDIGLCVTHDVTPSGGIAVETFGGLHGRLDAVALAARIRELRPSTALLMSRTIPDLDFERGVIFGCAVGLLAALGVMVAYEPVQLSPAGAVLH